jgi:hypothetical protein
MIACPVSRTSSWPSWWCWCREAMTSRETAEILSYSTRWVRILADRYNDGGPDRLGDQRVNNGTEATVLTPEALVALKERLKSSPDDGGQWTGPKIARWLPTTMV